MINILCDGLSQVLYTFNPHSSLLAADTNILILKTRTLNWVQQYMLPIPALWKGEAGGLQMQVQLAGHPSDLAKRFQKQTNK